MLPLHILSGSGVTGLGHFDGCATEVGIRAMIHKVQQMSTDAPSAGRYVNQ